MIEIGRFETASPDETERLARRIGESIEGPAAFLLVGDLGAGKTLFTRGLAAGLGIDPDEVSSPSFTLVNRYDGGRLRLYHLDLYRLDDGSVTEAVYDLGLEEIVEERAVVAIEWAERLGAFFVPNAYRVEIGYGDDPERRVIALSSEQ